MCFYCSGLIYLCCCIFCSHLYCELVFVVFLNDIIIKGRCGLVCNTEIQGTKPTVHTDPSLSVFENSQVLHFCHRCKEETVAPWKGGREHVSAWSERTEWVTQKLVCGCRSNNAAALSVFRHTGMHRDSLFVNGKWDYPHSANTKPRTQL